MPKVSVLMPIYHTQESHLREAIESILAQTYDDFEFIILNDSPDNTGLDVIIASYSDERIVYCNNENNIGISASRNKLLNMAQGEYLAVMDHDDISLPERFAKQVAFLDAHNDIGVVGTWAKLTNSTKLSKPAQHNDDIEVGLMSGCCIMHPTSMIRKSVLLNNDICYEEQFSPSEDYALWARLIGKTHFANIPEVLFIYRVHDDNTSHRQNEKMYKAGMAIRAFIKEENPLLWEKSLDLKPAKRIDILGIPFFFIYNTAKRTRCMLWDCIPLYSIKKSIKQG